MPATNPTSDGRIYVEKVGSNLRPLKVAVGTDATPLITATGGGPGLLWVSSTEGAAHAAALTGYQTGGTPPITQTLVGDESARTALVDNGTVWLQDKASVLGLSTSDSSASPHETFSLPLLAPTSTPGPSHCLCDPNSPAAGSVDAMAVAPNGDLLALTSTGYAAAVTDLDSGASQLLGSYGLLTGAAIVADGDLVTLASGGPDNGALHVLRISTSSLNVVSDTPLGTTSQDMRHVDIAPGLGHDCVISVSSGIDAANLKLEVFTLDGAHVNELPALPPSVGLDIAPASSHSVYLYGGPAENTTSVLDLVTGTLQQGGPTIQTPSGTYIIGILN
ncbi:MAG: hypothetical protein ACRDPG_12510 [Nocardioidaceae bacterium]